MALRPDAIPDFVNLTLSNFRRVRWTDISLEYPHYIASRVLKRYRKLERGGADLRWKVQVRNTGLARYSGMFDRDITGVEDLTIEGMVAWVKATVNWSYDIDESIFQSDRETIVDALHVREHSCHNDYIELMEEGLWSEPEGPTDNRPMGIPFWIQKDATTTPGGGFVGGNPSGFAAGAGSIDSTVYSRWKNWGFGYDSVTPDDLIKKIKLSLYKTDFKAPHPHPELGFGDSQHHIYTVYDVREALERLAESRNDNLKNDVAKYINNVLVGGIPVEAVHYLDANDTSWPVYGIDWSVLRPFVKRGVNFRRTQKPAPRQHTVREIHYDTWFNWICYNRRKLWVGSRA